MTDQKLTNFKSPRSLCEAFDRICRINRRTRTSVLIELMAKYVIDEGQAILDERNRVEAVSCKIAKPRAIMGFREWMAADAVAPKEDRDDWLPVPLHSDFDDPDPVF